MLANIRDKEDKREEKVLRETIFEHKHHHAAQLCNTIRLLIVVKLTTE
jgi:hypothetical protein